MDNKKTIKHSGYCLGSHADISKKLDSLVIKMPKRRFLANEITKECIICNNDKDLNETFKEYNKIYPGQWTRVEEKRLSLEVKKPINDLQTVQILTSIKNEDVIE